MKHDSIKKYVALRESLLKEKSGLEARLAEINLALGVQSSATSQLTILPPGRKRARNKLSLKDAVAQVTGSKGLTKPEILEAIKKIGYHFSTNDPMNSLNTVLYTGKVFKNVDGKFSLAK